MADSRIPADVSDAVYQLVRGFGAEKLAARTGTPAGTIYNKANPSDSTHHKPTLADALIWTQISGDFQVVHALCRTLGGVFVPLDRMAEHSDAALLDLVLRHDSEHGDFARALKHALEDGRISADDFDYLKKEGYEAISALLEMLARLEDMSRA